MDRVNYTLDPERLLSDVRHHDPRGGFPPLWDKNRVDICENEGKSDEYGITRDILRLSWLLEIGKERRQKALGWRK